MNFKIYTKSDVIIMNDSYKIFYNSVTAKDRHVINSSPFVDTKYENICGLFGQIVNPI